MTNASEAPTRAEIDSLIADAFHPDINPRYWMEKALLVLRSLAALTVPPPDDGCICKGNWRLIMSEIRPLIGKQFRSDRDGNLWTFYGLVDGEDDYYYGMYRDGDARLLSCVGSIEGHGYTLVADAPQQPPAPLDYTPIFAQHDETGRLWSGPRCKLPRRYAEIAGDAPSAVDDAVAEAKEFIVVRGMLSSLGSAYGMAQTYKDIAKRAVKLLDRLNDDRDEWKQQHENLLAVKAQDNAALSAQLASAQAEIVRLEGIIATVSFDALQDQAAAEAALASARADAERERERSNSYDKLAIRYYDALMAIRISYGATKGIMQIIDAAINSAGAKTGEGNG